MAVTDQKPRYRRQAELWYEIAAMIGGEKPAAMVRLGELYSSLATSLPDEQRAPALSETKNSHPFDKLAYIDRLKRGATGPRRSVNLQREISIDPTRLGQ
jgi:hypothetical protein